MKAIYKVTDIEVSKASNGYYVTWNYGGKAYWAQGEFYIDREGYLHHTFSTPTGKEKEFKIKVR